MNTLWHHAITYWGAGGFLLIPLAMICIGIWAYFLRSRDHMASMARECKELEHHVAHQGLTRLGSGQIARLLDRIQRDVLSGDGPRAAFHARSDECMEHLRRDIVILSALTAIAPLMGLLGTVRGMIATFAAVAQVSGNTGVDVADGISQALITTQFGLVVALPGLFGVSRLRALAREIEARLGTLRAAALAHLDSASLPEAA